MTSVKICPKCGSTKITSFTGLYAGQAEFFKYNCKECGYDGPVPEIDKFEIENFRKELKTSKGDTDASS